MSNIYIQPIRYHLENGRLIPNLLQLIHFIENRNFNAIVIHKNQYFSSLKRIKRTFQNLKSQCDAKATIKLYTQAMYNERLFGIDSPECG